MSLMSRARSFAPWLALAVALVGWAPLAEAQYGTSFGKNKIAYREFDWQIYRSPHFNVHYYTKEPALLEKVVSLAESAYDRLSRDFDYQIQEPTPLIFYETHSHFEQNNIILNFIPEGVGAFASPVRYRMVLPVDLPDGELYKLILHELTHIFQYRILFDGSLTRGVNMPQWVVEGMASYMAKDESTTDKMYLRDAVVNDRVPSIVQRGIGGFLAYRFGHAAFDYIESRWGKEGFRDFVFELRNTLGSRAEKAIERALRTEPEDFDADFRKWLRQQYLPQLVEKGEPSDFGRRFRIADDREAEAISPAASPSGDLVAAISTLRGDVDVVLFDARKRRFISNLTTGFSSDYQYLVAQFVTSAARMGRDIAFAPDGNRLALFAKREKGRSLVLIDVLKSKVERIIDMEVEQQHAPAFSADGQRVAFSANTKGRFDIFVYDLASDRLVNLTDDAAFDGAPAFSPDGAGLVYSSVVAGEHAQLFRLDLADPSKRYRLTDGEWDDRDATFSPDGKRLYFTSDRRGTDNIYSLDLGSGEVRQWTNAVTGCFMPTVLTSPEGKERLVYTGFWRGRFDLYVSDLETPIGEVTKTALPAEAAASEALPAFEPDIQVTVDEANRDKYRDFKLFLEDGGAYVGVANDQTVLGQTYLSFSDYLGDRRLMAIFSSVESFSNFDVVYADLSGRSNWSVRLFDNRTFYVGLDQRSGFLQRGQAAYKETGAIFSWIYPFSFYSRFEAGLGYIFRELDFQQVVYDPITGEPFYTIEPRKDDFPLVQLALVGDTSINTTWGPVSGRRWRLDGYYAPNTGGGDGGSTLAAGVALDVRQYVEVSQRSNLSMRLWAAASFGDVPSPLYIGGLDTIRGVDFRTLIGDRAFFANLEYRFPLLDALVGPFLDFRGIRGRFFLDIAGSWFDYAGEDFSFSETDDSRFGDAISSYGWGFTLRFGGLDLNWDFAKLWSLRNDDGGFRTEFWIGTGF